ncbi:hypothetical protein [Cognatilysobacter bugurensis]|uniref:Molecular chaperone n=1 Tax=Cognatilysobacter bugurensis TaxID=543356 RepID=A0A918WBF5_9GAMM|nr:hypothetical protein [Lysobacter bugurensis]GHA87715.1 hypothetical protein GCM10007067_27180 [Lysobacter bugurensis]
MIVSRRALRAVACACALVPGLTFAQGFSALVTPPRFEDRVAPGSTYRNVIEITNVSDTRARYALRTADWTLDPNGAASFSYDLAPGSCRPWVGIEAPELVVEPNMKRRYRFEVAVPADAPQGECRFAIMVEGDPTTLDGPVAMPVAGRIAVIVYVGVGDAAPQLEVSGARAAVVEGRRVPVLEIRNRGDAHGRLDGLVEGRDASGRRYAFTASTQPILAGETRAIALTAQSDRPDAPPPELVFPVTLSGQLAAGRQHVDVETTIAP